MAKRSIAPKPTTGREKTIFPGDFENPDHSLLGIRLQDVAAALTLLERLHGGAVELNDEGLSQAMGCAFEELEHSLMTDAIQTAGQHLIKAREALHDLFREVELKGKAPTPKAVA